MSTTTFHTRSTSRNLQHALEQKQRKLCLPEVHNYTLTHMETFGNSTREIPRRVTLLRPNPQDILQDQLFLDHMLLPRDAWRYDSHDRILTWRGAYGGGHLALAHAGHGGTGNIGAVDNLASVQVSSTANFLCDVALNTGATYETTGGTVVGFFWEPNSSAWNSATWIQQRLLLSYTVTTGTSFQPPSFTFNFQDNQTEAIPWVPMTGMFNATLQMGTRQDLTVWNLTFQSNLPPDADNGPNPPDGPDSVYPYWMQIVEDAGAGSLDGVMMIDNLAPQGTLVGIRGVRQNGLVTGYYQAGANAAPLGVFDGKLVIDGKPIPNTLVHGSTLYWSDLPLDLQQRTDLPAKGNAVFHPDGSFARDTTGAVLLRRLSSAETLSALGNHADLHPQAHQQHLMLQQALQSTTLDIYGLLAMNPYAQNDQGQWADMVQTAVMNDLSSIMNSFIPTDMWNLVFPNQSQTPLQGELAIVASSAVPGVPQPSKWYQDLATAVMTSGMAGGSDPNCYNMNGPRANQWLKTQVATSKVYYTHGQALFEYEWQQRFPLTSQYLNDQSTNAGSYQTQIDKQVAVSVSDIQQNVAADPTDPNMIPDLIAQVSAVGQYAKTNNLYWAFAYFTYNTSPTVLANIAMQIGIITGSSDGMTLARLFQQNASILTALDPSGYFARQYISTINIFLATNILPSMFDFSGTSANFDMIKQYLQYFVNNNLNSEDQEIATAASQISAILSDENAEQILQGSIAALRSFSEAIEDALALPFIANKFVTWFATTFPKFSAVANLFGSLLIGAITGLAVFNLITQFAEWDELTDEQKAQVIADASLIGLQIVAAVVKRGIRAYAIYGVEGMTPWQRFAAMAKITAKGDASQLDQALVRIGNATARWLGDTAGSVGKLLEGTLDFELGNNMNIISVTQRTNIITTSTESGWVGKIFGRNLDEFIATRIGPIFILVGIGFSIYSMTQGESGAELASDILNTVSGSLMLLAMIGTWAIEGGLVAAEGLMATIISAAGPLGILAALAGVGLMIYELFRKPPDPVEEFVNSYVKLAGFYVTGTSSSIDYAIPYINPDQPKLLMIGFTLASSDQALIANNDGSISLGNATSLPNCVWQVTTDGLGMSQILTVIQPDSANPPVTVFLSLMSDNTLSFQPSILAATSSGTPTTGEPTVITQTWLSAPTGNAQLTSTGNYLKSLNLTLQAVPPDINGNYSPSQASGYLVAGTSGLSYADSNTTSFTLTMSGMAPNYMKMVDVSFILNSTPSQQQSFGPTFGVIPSTPMTFTLSPQPPAFLNFDTSAGTLVPNGAVATTASSSTSQITASNTLGQAQTSFTLSVAASSTAPTAMPLSVA